MGDDEEEEFAEGDWNTWPAFDLGSDATPAGTAIPKEQESLLRIKFRSRDYSMRQFSETIRDAEAMVQIFSVPEGAIRAYRRPRDQDWAVQVREGASETIEVRAVSLSSPLEIVYHAVGAAAAVGFALNRWITMKANWEKAREAKAIADSANAASRVANAEADRDVKKAELESLALNYVKQYVQEECQKDYDSLPSKHPLKKMANRTMSAMTELASASVELDRGKK